jgi:hypothetical protein
VGKDVGVDQMPGLSVETSEKCYYNTEVMVMSKTVKCDFCGGKIVGVPAKKYGGCSYCTERCWENTKANLASKGLIVVG